MRPPRWRGRRSSCASAAAATRTSQALTDSRSRPAACSMPALSCSGRRRLMRAVAASSPSGGAGAALVGRGLDRLVARGRRHDEVGLAGAQAQLDRAGRELARDLVRGGRQRIEQHQPDGRLERGAQALGERAGLLTSGLGGDRELTAEVLDVLRQVHGASMTPKWCQCNTRVASPWCGPASRGRARGPARRGSGCRRGRWPGSAACAAGSARSRPGGPRRSRSRGAGRGAGPGGCRWS